MQDQRHRLFPIFVDKQDHQLAVAILGSMMWTGTPVNARANRMKVERSNEAQTSLLKPLACKLICFGTGLACGKKGGKSHTLLSGSNYMS